MNFYDIPIDLTDVDYATAPPPVLAALACAGDQKAEAELRRRLGI